MLLASIVKKKISNNSIISIDEIHFLLLGVLGIVFHFYVFVEINHSGGVSGTF